MNINYTFYSPNGKIISAKEFLDLYTSIYFFSNPDLKQEKEIEEILKKGTLSCKDIIKIFEWKTGRHSKDNKTVKYRSITIKAADVKKAIVKGVNSPEKLLDELLKIDGISSVYAITVLYFLTRGENPIYDRFAQTAVDAIINKTPFGQKIIYCELSNAKKGINLLKRYKERYADSFAQIKGAFGKEVSERDIDRALWAYGHLFYKEK